MSEFEAGQWVNTPGGLAIIHRFPEGDGDGYAWLTPISYGDYVFVAPSELTPAPDAPIPGLDCTFEQAKSAVEFSVEVAQGGVNVGAGAIGRDILAYRNPPKTGWVKGEFPPPPKDERMASYWRLAGNKEAEGLLRCHELEHAPLSKLEYWHGDDTQPAWHLPPGVEE